MQGSVRVACYDLHVKSVGRITTLLKHSYHINHPYTTRAQTLSEHLLQLEHQELHYIDHRLKLVV